ncbi:helix-turn-helix domain-containing protein [Jiangella alkaliphila]|uniref:Zn-dependent peptidase ImmA, M78 family n=1 Tax=Jiangella alkaliphila TaxID=419479 RepID=A0A1H2H0Y7_9ACTN|nr:XRE family transcriptional regulator [Jiangella alkaliphila]SDU25493.1 Zn-dependent peptidase ImmA, M78 family [Jiangella alkaliphila]
MAHEVTAARVRQVIKESSLTQAQFAVKAGLDAPKMSKSLTGTRRFTSLELAQIAELGSVTVDWLLGAERQLPALAARAPGAASLEVMQVIDRARRLAQFRSDLAFLGYEQNVPELPRLPERRRLVDQGSYLANQALAYARAKGIEPHEVRDIADAIEDAFEIDVAILDLPDHFDGLAWSDPEAKLIVVAASEIPARQRFTLAHELEHILAGDDQALIIDENIDDPERKKHPSEMKANSFAASFLMPEDVIREAAAGGALTEESFAQLSVNLSVSPSSLAWRLHDLRIIDRRQHEIFRRITMARAADLVGSVGDLAEWIAVSSRSRVPGRLVRGTLDAYTEGKATIRPFANLIGADPSQIRLSIDEAGVPLP